MMADSWSRRHLARCGADDLANSHECTDRYQRTRPSASASGEPDELADGPDMADSAAPDHESGFAPNSGPSSLTYRASLLCDLGNVLHRALRRCNLLNVVLSQAFRQKLVGTSPSV